MAAPRTSLDPARSAALDLIGAVVRQRRTLEEALDGQRSIAGLAARDRAFARNLAATTLRRLGQIDALIDGCLERPLPAKAGGAHDLLRLGVCQLVFLETPPHAAVDTTVELAKRQSHGAYKKLINAVLRRLSRQGTALAKAQDAARLNTPDWLWDSWSAAYGPETCRTIAQAHLGEPALDLTVKEDSPTWAERLGGTVLPTGTVRLSGAGPVTALAGFAEGAWWVQDAAAALPAMLFGEVKGRRVIDLGAAPGGKTAQLAAAGARVIAVDRSAKRLERLKANLARLGLGAETLVADAEHWRPQAPADAVLLDAPCSATGTIRRHPDVVRLKAPEDVSRLAAAQGRLLAAAAEMVKPGGILVYSACSLERQEGPELIAALLHSGAPFARRPIRAREIGGLSEVLSGAGDLRSLPCHLAGAGGMDGFYAARLGKL